MRITCAPEYDLPLFTVVTNDMDGNSSEVPVVPVKDFHNSRPFAFISENAATKPTAVW